MRASISLILAAAAAATATDALAQVLPDTPANRARGVVGCVQSGGAIRCPGAPSGGGGGGGSSYYNSMMGAYNTGVAIGNILNRAFQEAERQAHAARVQQAIALNNQGIAAYNRGDFASAAHLFQQATGLSPHDPNVRGNLAEAQKRLAEQRAAIEREQRRQMAEAKVRIDNMLGGLQSQLANERSTLNADLADATFVEPRGTSFFGLGGGKGAAPAPAKPGELAFVAPGDSLFSKGTQYSAPVDLRDTASDQFAAAPPIGAGAATRPTESGGGLQFVAPDQAAVPPSPATTTKGTVTATVTAPPPRKPAPPAAPEAIDAPASPAGLTFLPQPAVSRLAARTEPSREDRLAVCRELAIEAAALWSATRRAVLADDVYKRFGEKASAGAPELTGFTRVSDDAQAMRKLFPGMNDQSIRSFIEPTDSDYRAAIYRDKTDPNKVFLAFRGTQTPQDWIKGNIPQGLGAGSQYYAKAIALAKLMKKSADAQGLDMEIVGHSLGGGMASAAGTANRVRTTTFNPAGVHVNTLPAGTDLSAAKQYVTYYVVRGDPLNWMQDRRGPVVAGIAGAVTAGGSAVPGVASVRAGEAIATRLVTGEPSGSSTMAPAIDTRHDLPPAIGNRVTLDVNPLDGGVVQPHLMGSVRHAIDDRLKAVKSERTARGCAD